MTANQVESPRMRTGVLMGLTAILLWSTSSALVAAGGKRLGVWPFLALTSTIGGVTQIVAYRYLRGSVRDCFILPWTLWPLIVFAFALYGFVYTLAVLMSGSAGQVYAVNLINYLWPALTVVCALLWVPGTRMSKRLVAAVVISVLGITLANRNALAHWFAGPSGGAASGEPLFPYLLAGVAAVSWAVYSSLLARWRAWSHRYPTAPVGFLIMGAIASILALKAGGRPPLDARTLAVVLIYGVGPCGVGYMLWEMALARAPADRLGLLAAIAPVVSTLLLGTVQNVRPDKWLLAAAALIGLAVILSQPRRSPRTSPEVATAADRADAP
jgi:drug/metabolite transporter (DMT)-like permease